MVTFCFTPSSVSLLCSGMTIPEEDTEAGQTGKYCLVAIGRLQVCADTDTLTTLITLTEWQCSLCIPYGKMYGGSFFHRCIKSSTGFHKVVKEWFVLNSSLILNAVM